MQADFSGGTLSTDAGALLLRQIDLGLGVSLELAQCFCDARNQTWVDHSLRELLRQRLLAKGSIPVAWAQADFLQLTLGFSHQTTCGDEPGGQEFTQPTRPLTRAGVF